jgi:hypothetical protein
MWPAEHEMTPCPVAVGVDEAGRYVSITGALIKREEHSISKFKLKWSMSGNVQQELVCHRTHFHQLDRGSL